MEVMFHSHLLGCLLAGLLKALWTNSFKTITYWCWSGSKGISRNCKTDFFILQDRAFFNMFVNSFSNTPSTIKTKFRHLSGIRYLFHDGLFGLMLNYCFWLQIKSQLKRVLSVWMCRVQSPVPVLVLWALLVVWMGQMQRTNLNKRVELLCNYLGLFVLEWDMCSNECCWSRFWFKTSFNQCLERKHQPIKGQQRWLQTTAVFVNLSEVNKHLYTKFEGLRK